MTAEPDASVSGLELIRQSAYAVFELTGDRLARRQPLETHHADWLESDIAPGSIAKLATIAEALARGAIDDNTHIACTRRLTLADGRRADCSHPPAAAPFDAADAIAQSCNVFAATAARRLSRAQLSNGLVALGLAPLGSGEDPVAAAIGLGEGRVHASRLIDVLLRAMAGPPSIREGLSRAADGGTASAMARAGVSAFAKTGTSSLGGRSLGLTVAAASRSHPTHAAIVLLPGGSGADAAEIAAGLLRSFTRSEVQRVRIGRPLEAGGYDPIGMDLEDYVADVVAGETPADVPAAAREALAIAARTFALANRGRHAADGFDLCSLTHCQVVRPADPGARLAARTTTGRVLQANRRVVPVFYSAECGGVLDAASAVAGDAVLLRGLPWTRARPDPAGGDEPEWNTVIEASSLEAALRRAGLRGQSLTGLRVDVNEAGRVRRVHVVGFVPDVLGIDDFRRLVGRDLGWNIVRSTRFEIRRAARGYELRGRGRGHGVGLCVLGASRLARSGRNSDEILAAYFPGLAIGDASRTGTGDGSRTGSGGRRRTVVRLQLPAASERQREWLLALVERSLASLSRDLSSTPPESLDLVVHPTAESFGRATARPWWTSAAARVDAGRWRIDAMPLEALQAGGRLESTLRHELVHVLADERLEGRPLWVREGVAMHFAGERVPPLDGPCPADAELRSRSNRDTMATTYRRAAACVERALRGGTAWPDLGR